MAYELVEVSNEADWHAYHLIRRRVLWDAKGRRGYDPTRPEERASSNHPFLLKLDQQPIGTTRLDDRGDSTGVVRLVAIAIDLQRRGHGRVLSASVEDYARRSSLTTLFVNAAPDAIGFYEKMGWSARMWDETELVGISADCTQMSKALSVQNV